jgi:Domain of unknown function (DUF4386)
MSTVTRTRLAAVFGLLNVVGTFAGLAIHGYPDIGASGRQIAHWATTTNQHQFAIGIYVEAVAILLFLGFAAWLWSVTRDAEGGSGWLATAGFSAAALYVVLALTSNAVWWAVLDSGHRGTNPQTLASIRDIAQHTFDTSNLCLGMFLILGGYVLFSTRALPRLVGATAVVFGLGLMVPQSAMLAMIPVFVWIVAVSIYLLVRPNLATTVREPAGVMSARPVGTS